MTLEHLSNRLKYLPSVIEYFKSLVSKSGGFTRRLLLEIFQNVRRFMDKDECVEGEHSILIRIFELCDMMRSDRRHNNRDNTERLKRLIQEFLEILEIGGGIHKNIVFISMN